MSNTDWEIVRNEISETKAHLYLTKLKQEGLNAVITNDSMATMIPMHNSGYIIRVPAHDAFKASEILKVYENELESLTEEDFYDADLTDIAYQKSLQKSEEKIKKAKVPQVWIIGIIVLIFVILMLIRQMQ